MNQIQPEGRLRWHKPDIRAAQPSDSEDAAIMAGPEEAAAQYPEPTAPKPGHVENHAREYQEGKEGRGDRTGFLMEQLDRWLSSMERLRLSEYIRYVDDRKRMFWNSFWGGVARGVGMAVGFTILGAVLVLILQNLAKRNLPLIGDALAQIVSIVQKQLK